MRYSAPRHFKYPKIVVTITFYPLVVYSKHDFCLYFCQMCYSICQMCYSIIYMSMKGQQVSRCTVVQVVGTKMVAHVSASFVVGYLSVSMVIIGLIHEQTMYITRVLMSVTLYIDNFI